MACSLFRVSCLSAFLRFVQRNLWILGALIILMLWFYFTGAAILIGGEINSEIEQAAAKEGKSGARDHGKGETGKEIKVHANQRA